jgi:hypothetical protein
VERNINLLIDHQCPQCGAPAELNETDRLFRCAFCKVTSYLLEQGCFRYVLPHNAPADRDLVYFPYWRFKGMLFSCLSDGIQHRFLDISRQALDSPLFPASLGLRSQALKLRFVTPELKGWFIKPVLSMRQVMQDFLQRANLNLPRPIFHQTHIGESLSLIYSPFYADNKIIDAVLNHPVSAETDAAFDPRSFPGGQADWRIHFISTLCPNCGWDMHGHRDALALHCDNCDSMWQASKKEMTRINVAHMPGASDADTLYLPFWRIRADVGGMNLLSYADLVRAANLPKTVRPEWERIPFYFWGPAFKVRPRSLLRLIHQVTLSQPADGLLGQIPKGTMHPVNLPIAEAIETLKLNLGGLIRPRKRFHERIAQIRVKPRRYLLVYLPFDVRHHDLVQTRYHISINRNQLALANNL